MAFGSIVRGRRGHLACAQAVVVLALMLVTSAQSARAGIHWCSADPVFTFQRGGVLSTWVLDVQVMVPLEQLPLASAARLDVSVPSNVAVSVVNPPNPVFPVVVGVQANAPAASDDPYFVTMRLLVPASETQFPVRLLITDPLNASVRIVEGVAGQMLSVPVRVGR